MKAFEAHRQELGKIALEALDACVPFEAGEAMRHVFVMFFLKFISDLRLERSEDRRSAPGMNSTWGTIVIPPDCSWGSWRILSHDELVSRLGRAMKSAEMANRDLLGGAFGEIRFGELSASGLSTLFNLISGADLRPSSFLQRWELEGFFEDLLDMIAERRPLSAGEYSVPSEVSRLLACLLDPKPRESLLDPVCGSGRLLAALVRHAGPEHGLVAGQDWRVSALSFCKMNMVALGISPHISVSDPLRKPLMDQSGEMLKADVVIGNPPFGMRSRDLDIAYERPDLLRRSGGLKGGSEFSFIVHMLEVARENGGRIGVVVPYGVLFRGGWEREIRANLVEENLLAGVVALPPGLFYGTGISVAVLVFLKNKRDKGVMFIDGSRSFSAAGRVNRLPGPEVDRIAKAFEDKEDVQGFCRLVLPDEIRGHDFNLVVTRYVQQERAIEAARDIRDLEKDISETEVELAEVRSDIGAILKSLGLETT